VTQRRVVRAPTRPVYGRVEPLARTRRRHAVPRPSLLQRRLVILVIFTGVVIYGLWHSFEITKADVQSADRKAEITAETLKLTHAGLGQRNLLTLDSGQLESDLLRQDPLLRSVDVRRSWPHGLVVSSVPKQPSMGWETGDQRYVLDRDGTVIGELAANSPLPVVTDGSNLPVKIGSQVVAARFVTFATDLVGALAGQGIAVKHMDVKDTTFDLSVSTNKSFRLVFDTSRPVAGEIEDLKSILALLAVQHRAPAEYIDLRIAGKAYYK
jgi:cell division septal protein FtsQ